MDGNLDSIWHRLKELEQDLETLRVGRRILMRLIEDLKREHHLQVENLKRENLRLRKRLARLSRALGKDRLRLVKTTEQ